ncbi:hypothetical protein HK405_011117 [Cladochytrium tenue]|nr:hypothetical protein HK405_011117 [Cladochytrium tenue]
MRYPFAVTAAAALSAATAASLVVVASGRLSAAAPAADVDERFPYTGPDVPIGDWVDQTVNGNGKGFPRLVEPPAVRPSGPNPTNNVNVIALSYIPRGVNVHFQTPFGLGEPPAVRWGRDASHLDSLATGSTHTYARTPPCSEVIVTQCSQFFHEVQIGGLDHDTTYYYQIPAANGTTTSDVLSFRTARKAGDPRPFTAAVLNDMGYTNAQGTFQHLLEAASGTDGGLAFAWHGGDISYADDWYSGILPCADDWPVCYNGTSTSLPGTGPVPDEYKVPLPAGEKPNQGGPQGGDMSVLYESNWDLWQQWINNLTVKVPYMVLPGNHEAACAEFDGPNFELTAYLVNNKTNATAPANNLTYYSCPPTQRQHRFRMPGTETSGVGNFWYSFDYGLAHFISINGETDYPYSPEWPFVRDLKTGETLPTESETFITDSGPFGYINGSWKDYGAYEQLAWLKRDLAAVDREKTPWVIAMSHRPMYSSQVSSYQKYMRNAFEGLLLQYGVDLYLSGYERLFPLGANQTIDSSSIVNNGTYYTNPGVSMTHIVNGMAGNIESHSTLASGKSPLNITAVLDQEHYGFSKLTVENATALRWQFVRGLDGQIGDELVLLKRPGSGGGGGGGSSSSSVMSSSSAAYYSATAASSTKNVYGESSSTAEAVSESAATEVYHATKPC